MRGETFWDESARRAEKNTRTMEGVYAHRRRKARLEDYMQGTRGISSTRVFGHRPRSPDILPFTLPRMSITVKPMASFVCYGGGV